MPPNFAELLTSIGVSHKQKGQITGLCTNFSDIKINTAFQIIMHR